MKWDAFIFIVLMLCALVSIFVGLISSPGPATVREHCEQLEDSGVRDSADATCAALFLRDIRDQMRKK